MNNGIKNLFEKIFIHEIDLSLKASQLMTDQFTAAYCSIIWCVRQVGALSIG